MQRAGRRNARFIRGCVRNLLIGALVREAVTGRHRSDWSYREDPFGFNRKLPPIRMPAHLGQSRWPPHRRAAGLVPRAASGRRTQPSAGRASTWRSRCSASSCAGHLTVSTSTMPCKSWSGWHKPCLAGTPPPLPSHGAEAAPLVEHGRVNDATLLAIPVPAPVTLSAASGGPQRAPAKAIRMSSGPLGHSIRLMWRQSGCFLQLSRRELE